MHEYFAISVHFVVFYTVFNQKPWHFATFSRKIIRLSDNLGEVMITQRFHHFITRQNYLLLKTDVLRRGSNLQFIRSWSYVPLTIASMRIITKLITFSSLNAQLSWLQVRKVRSNLVKAEMRVLQKTQKKSHNILYKEVGDSIDRGLWPLYFLANRH